MALSVDRNNDQIRVLSDLSEDVVGALLDEHERTSETDPFAAALRRCQEEGHPEELAGSWRRALAPRPLPASGHAANVLRLLARDLLSCVAARGGDEEPAPEPEPEAPSNVRPISGGPAANVPALELSSDGTWRPSTASGTSTDAELAQRRQAHVPSMSSRYPTMRGDGQHVMLPAPPAALAAPPRVTPPSPVDPPPPPGPVPVAPAVPAPPAAASDDARGDESVIRAVSAGTEVVAGPFERFQELAAFTKALRELGVVQSVDVRQFVRGLVHLRVRHAVTTDLAAALLTLTDFSPLIASSTPTRIELRVVVRRDAAPTPD